MPTYQYVCTECGGQIEAVQKFTDDPLTVHECGGRLRKVFSPVGIVFKGSGFYRTDSRSGPGSTLPSSPSSSSSDPGSGSSSPSADSGSSSSAGDKGSSSSSADKATPSSSSAKTAEKVA